MKLEALRRALVRLFGPRATSVSPLFEPKPLVTVSTNLDMNWIPLPPAAAHPIPPVGNEMPWSTWRQLEAELDPPAGWSACRFPTLMPGEAAGEYSGICAFVFGIVRGDFGVWRQPYPVCITDDDGMLVDHREDVLAAVTHLPSGLGMGLFTDRESAIASCTAAEGLGIDWRRIHPDNKRTWVDSISRMQQARVFAGIGIVHDRHAHIGSPEGPRISIWQQRASAVTEGRPEKLS